MAIDYVQSYVSRIDRLDWNHVRKIYADMELRAKSMLRDAGVAPTDVMIERTVEMRYLGQGYEIPVPVSDHVLKSGSDEGLREAFRQRYEALYERSLPEIPLQALVWRLVGSGPVPDTDLRASVTSPSTQNARKGQRRAYMPEKGDFIDVPTFDRYRMKPGDSLEGPAMIEERESTVILGLNCRGSVDDYLNLLVEFN
jgi:N-methylhydantoinase A